MTLLSLNGRTAFITGGSRGLGLAIACRFAEAGAHVGITGRDRVALNAALTAAEQHRVSPPQVIRSFIADIVDQSAMMLALEQFTASAGPLTVLVNNAAILGPVGNLDDTDWGGWRETIDVDLIAPINLCRLVVPAMRSHSYGKIVNVSGGGATGPRPRFSAYATAKAGLVRFTETLAAELRGTGIDVNAIAPGPMDTRMLEEVVTAGPDVAGAEYHDARRLKLNGAAAPERAARLAVFLSSAASDGITGRLISAIWDPWEDLVSHRDDLQRSDIYTLRRIVPKDRGFAWGDR